LEKYGTGASKWRHNLRSSGAISDRIGRQDEPETAIDRQNGSVEIRPQRPNSHELADDKKISSAVSKKIIV
jgi:hypothetical protein